MLQRLKTSTWMQRSGNQHSKHEPCQKNINRLRKTQTNSTRVNDFNRTRQYLYEFMLLNPQANCSRFLRQCETSSMDYPTTRKIATPNAHADSGHLMTTQKTPQSKSEQGSNGSLQIRGGYN